MGAVGRDPAVVQHHDAVRPPDLRQPVGDEQRGAAALHVMQRALNLVLGGAVDGAGGVVQDQDARVFQKGARQGDALPLAARQGDPALADDGVVAVLKRLDEVMGGGRARGRFEVAPAGAGAGEGDVVGHRQREQEYVLFDGGDLRAQAGQVPVAQVDAVDGDAPGAGVVGAVHQLGEGGLGGPGLADQRHRFSGGDAQVDVGQHRLSRLVVEGDPLEGNGAAHGGPVPAGVLIQLGGGGDHGQDAARPGDAVAHLREAHGRLVARVAEQRHQPDEGDQFAQFDAARAQQHDPVQERQRGSDAEGEQRRVQRLDAALAHQQVAEHAGSAVEALPFPGLAHGGLDHLDAGNHLFRHRRQPPVLGALLGERRRHAPHVVAHRGGERQTVERRHHRQPGVDQRHVGERHREPDRQVGQVDDAGVDHFVDQARVVGSARHQIADPLPVVEGLTLAQQAAVQFVARVALQPVAQGRGADHDAEQRRGVGQHDAQQPAGRQQQLAAAEAVDHHLRAAADHHRGQGEHRPRGELAEHRQREHHRIAAQVGDDPAPRSTGIERGAARRRAGGRGELRDHGRGYAE